MTYPRFDAPPPPPADRPDPAAAPTPEPADVPDFESLVALGVGAVTSFHAAHPGHYERLHRDYVGRSGAGRTRPLRK